MTIFDPTTISGHVMNRVIHKGRSTLMGHKRGGLRIPIGIKRPANLHTIGKKAACFADVGLRKATNTFQQATPIALLAGTAAGIGPTAAGVTALGAAATGVSRKFVTQPLRKALGD